MPSSVAWTPGGHHGLVWPGGLALVDGAVALDAAIATWRRLADGGDLADFFAAVGEATGRDLLHLPAFAVLTVDPGGQARAAARGSLAVVAQGEVDQVVDGSRATTWLEAHLGNPRDVSLVGGGLEGADAEDVVRPVASGLVTAAGLIWSVVATADAEAKAAAVAAPLTETPSRAADPESTLPPEVSSGGTGVADPEAVLDPSGVAAQVPEMDEPADAPAEAPAPETPDHATPAVPAGGRVEEPGTHAPSEPASAPVELFADLWSTHTSLEPVEASAVRPAEDHEEDSALGRDAQGSPGVQADVEEPQVDVEDPHVDVEGPGSAVGGPYAGDRAPREPVASSQGLISSVPGMSPPQERAARASAGGSDARRTEVLDWQDRDGHTALSVDPSASEAPPAPSEDGEEGADDSSWVRACVQGHFNPMHGVRCRVCREDLGEELRTPAVGAVGTMRTPSGEMVELDRSAVVGRQPTASRFQGTTVPRLVTVDFPHVSGTHLEVRVEGWSVVACDVSRNGTYLRRNQDPPVRLKTEGEVLVSGDVLDLGHGVHLAFEDLA